MLEEEERVRATAAGILNFKLSKSREQSWRTCACPASVRSSPAWGLNFFFPRRDYYRGDYYTVRQPFLDGISLNKTAHVTVRDRFATTSRGAFAVSTARSSARRYLKRLLRYDVKTNVRARGRVIDAQRLLKSKHESSFHDSACKYQPGIRHGFSLAVLSSAVTTAHEWLSADSRAARDVRHRYPLEVRGCFVSQVVWLVSRTWRRATRALPRNLSRVMSSNSFLLSRARARALGS